jgi:hypothetical protein
LSKHDEQYLLECLKIEPNEHCYDLLSKFDICYQKAFSTFKNKHLNEGNKGEDVVNSIINSSIVKQLRCNRNLKR